MGSFKCCVPSVEYSCSPTIHLSVSQEEVWWNALSTAVECYDTHFQAFTREFTGMALSNHRPLLRLNNPTFCQ